jgi:lysophospholipase L1-like esterase
VTGAVRRGLVAVGDSITNGEGQPMLGVRCQSWALWLASALELPYTGLAQNVATARQAVAEQVPRLRGPYDLGCVYLGVNDVRNPAFALAPFVEALDEVLAAVSRAAERVLVVTVPLDLGRPPAPPERIAGADAEIERLAREHGAGVLDLRELRGWTLILPDAVHLTAVGQLHVATLAAGVLGAQRSPAELADPHRSVRARVGYALSTHAAAVGRDRRRRFVER